MRQPKEIPTELQLWDGDYIAGILQMKPKYFKEHVATATGFPQAIRLPLAGGGRSTPRWMADEVLTWMQRHQEKRAA